jgi:hypothetical protein
LSRPVIERVGSWVLGKPQSLEGGEVLGEVRDPATRENEGREGERERGREAGGEEEIEKRRADGLKAQRWW